ncbi:MAG: metallopeptidase family protein, partial [Kiritimatiellae bacterium]|nr:metallopeptidase family protein [Kiritimatiellia bacterium]
MVADGIEPDLLGLFLGPDLPGRLDDATFDPLPTEILLFLDNILDYAEDDLPTFREEVRLTYLHELGHLLGLDETDLADRSLD